jgi:hypothetical protein
LICFKTGKQELYNLETDLSESKNVLSDNPEVAARLMTLAQRFITDGRSTKGAVQRNDFDLSLIGARTEGKSGNEPSQTQPNKRKKRQAPKEKNIE